MFHLKVKVLKQTKYNDIILIHNILVYGYICEYTVLASYFFKQTTTTTVIMMIANIDVILI